MTTALQIHIIDDDEAVRTSLVFALEAVGFRVSSYPMPVNFWPSPLFNEVC